MNYNTVLRLFVLPLTCTGVIVDVVRVARSAEAMDLSR
jgi:hypothetical protein